MIRAEAKFKKRGLGDLEEPHLPGRTLNLGPGISLQRTSHETLETKRPVATEQLESKTRLNEHVLHTNCSDKHTIKRMLEIKLFNLTFRMFRHTSITVGGDLVVLLRSSVNI